MSKLATPGSKPEPAKETQSWDDKVADALPAKATFFNAMRTDAFVNHNVINNFVEFWVALQVNEREDKWRVMHYLAYDLDQKDGKFQSEVVTKTDVTFPEAVFQLARAEYTAEKMLTHKRVDVPAKYPAENFPELKVHYYDVEHYKPAANIEGFAFDEYNQPYRRVQGKIFADATFKRSEVANSILGIGQAETNDKIRARVEEGILSDIFNAAVEPYGSLETKLTIGQVLALMDEFTVQVSGVYLGVRKMLRLEANLDAVAWLSPADREDFGKVAEKLVAGVNEANAYKHLKDELLPRANDILTQVKALGVHTEPFQKFVAECELYINLVHAAQNVARLNEAMMRPNGSDGNLLVQIREAVDRAQAKFIDLGGTEEKMDKLKAWVAKYSRAEADPEKDLKKREEMVPPWLAGFMSRYYERRSAIMKRVHERNAGLTQVKLLPAGVKPGVTDEFNEVKAPEPEKQQAEAQATPKESIVPEMEEGGELFNKYKGFGEGKKPRI